jgi:CubicO group peptidase (beta-lactamase class C family)
VPISDFFTEEANLFNGDKTKITIKNLLNHTSGLTWDGYTEHVEFSNSLSPVKYVLGKELEAIPGEKYNYNSGGTHLISYILTKITGKKTLEFANEVFFNPMHFESVEWLKLKDGVCDGAGFGLKLDPKDLIKIGNLFLSNGNFNNQRILSEKWIRKSFDESQKLKTKWGFINSSHGYGWYSALSSNNEILYSMGYGGQFILIIPSTKLVIVSAHNADTPNEIEQQVDFISETLPKIITKFGD